MVPSVKSTYNSSKAADVSHLITIYFMVLLEWLISGINYSYCLMMLLGYRGET